MKKWSISLLCFIVFWGIQWARCSDKVSVITIDAGFSKLPSSDEELTVTIPAASLPQTGATVFKPVPECPWKFEQAELTASEGSFSLMVTAPAVLGLQENTFDPALLALVSVTDQEQKVHHYRVRLCPDPALVKRLTQKPEPITMLQSSKIIEVDGTLKEWKDIPYIMLPSKNTLSKCVRFCWRPEGIYGSVSIPDNHVKVDTIQTWTGDGLELWLETDNARSWDRTRSRHFIKFHIAPLPEKGPGKAHYKIINSSQDLKPDLLKAVWKKTQSGYTMEFLIPKPMLAPAAMAPGTLLGFHFVLFNDGGHYEEIIPYEKGFFRKPYVWGMVKLI